MHSSLKLQKSFEEYKNNPAIFLSTEKFITYETLKDICESITSQIEQKVSNDNLIIMTFLPQTVENLIICLAILEKYTCFPVNDNLTKKEFELIFNSITPHIILTDEDSYSFIADITQNYPIDVCLIDSNFHTDSIKGDLPRISLNWIRINHRPNKNKIIIDNYSLLLSTSGTTGTPKLVGLTFNQLMAATETIQATLRLTSKDVVLHALPMYHIGAFVDLLLVPLLTGGSIRVKKVTDTIDIINIICSSPLLESKTNNEEQGKITWYQCVPAMLSDLIRHDNYRMVGQLKFIRVVSSPLPNSLMDEFCSKFNIPLIPMYGMTEAAGQITSWGLNNSERKRGSVGKVSNVPVCIIKENNINDNNINGNSIQANNNVINTSSLAGEICISGPQVINKYINGTSKLSSHILIKNELWFKTGDKGFIDEDGFLFITGRIKDLINRGGEKISIQNIDNIMIEHSVIAECATFAIPHPTLGEEVALAVVPIIDTELLNSTETIKSIQEFSAKYLPHFQQPKVITLVDSLPKTGSGKVQRHILAKQYEVGTPFSSEKNLQERDLSSTSITNTRLTTEIIELWSELLKIEAVKPDDNFFLLGGDSLLAASFIDKLILRYPNISPDWLISLYDYPTAEEFAHQLQQELKSANELSTLKEGNQLIQSEISLDKVVNKGLRSFLSAWSGERVDKNGLVIAKNKNGTQTPFFWCVQSYQEFNNLVCNLPSNTPVYGMRSLYRIQDPEDRNYESLAQYYAEVILSLPISEPYYLGGFCEGGAIMSLVAKYITEQGKDVALLILQDKFLQSDKLYADTTMLCWSNNLLKNDKLASYLKDMNHPFSNFIAQDNFTASHYLSPHNFFFPEFRWLYMQNNNKNVVIYDYDCSHNELNTIYTHKFANDLIYEMQRIRKGLTSTHQTQKPDSLILIDPKELAYNLSIKVAKVISSKNNTLRITVDFTNLSNQPIPPSQISGLTLCSQWLNHSGKFRLLAGVAVIETPILAKESKTFDMSIMVPNKPGLKFYQLKVSLVQEGFYWLDEKGLPASTHRVIIY